MVMRDLEVHSLLEVAVHRPVEVLGPPPDRSTSPRQGPRKRGSRFTGLTEDHREAGLAFVCSLEWLENRNRQPGSSCPALVGE